MTTAALRRRPLVLALVALLTFLAFPRFASAAGSARADSSTLTEADGKWRLKMTIDYGGMPDVAFVPMLFIFEPTMLYERSLTDESPEKPTITKKALSNMTTINESMDVSFGDGSGKMFKVTKFDFVIRRDRGFEAGEYKLTIKFADSGKALGQPIRLVLNGDNVVVDRRSISFVGDKAGGGKKKPTEAPKSDAPKSDGAGDGASGTSDGASSGASDSGSSSGSSDGASADGTDPGTVPPKQGGCGCKVAGEPSGSSAPWLLSALGLTGLALRRRRR